MRALILALLLANLGYLAWSQWLAPDRSGAATAAVGPRNAVPGIRLVGEPAAPAGTAAAATQAAAAPAGPAGPAPGGAANDAQAASAAGADSATAAAPATPTGAPDSAAPPDRCVSLGAFASLDDVAQLTQLLKAAGREPRQRPADGMVPDGFMVVVEGLPTVAEQERVQRRLRRGGLDDAIALPRLDDTYSVSVGTFAEKRRAERRAAVVTKMGMKAGIEVRQRAGTVYWIDVDVAATATDVAGSIKAALGNAPVASDWQELPCPAPPAVR